MVKRAVQCVGGFIPPDGVPHQLVLHLLPHGVALLREGADLAGPALLALGDGAVPEELRFIEVGNGR